MYSFFAFAFKISTKMHKNENTQNSNSFWLLLFFRGICLSRRQRIWNKHNILRLLVTQGDISKEKFFRGHIGTFTLNANAKKLYFSKVIFSLSH